MIPSAATRDSPSWPGTSGRSDGERQPATVEREAVIAAYGVGNPRGKAAALSAALETGPVYNRLCTPGFVLFEYFGFLRRDPDNEPYTDMDGHDFWLWKMDSFTLAGEDVRLERDAF